MIRRHGLLWPDELSDFQIDMMLWKYHRIEPYCYSDVKDYVALFFDAVKAILSPDEWVISRWSEEHVNDWTNESFLIVWGCASSSKSWDFGLLALLDFYADPQHTITKVASTTRSMLIQRTFASLIHYHRLFKRKGLDVPGVLRQLNTAPCLVLGGSDEELYSTKAGIHSIAVREGPVEDAVAFIRGTHAKCVNVIADELSSMPEAIIAPSLLANLRSGSEVFRFVGLTNITSRNDLAGRNSVPKNGWGSVTIDTEFWRTARGAVRRHDGFRSPGLEDPKRYPFLLTKAALDDIVRQEGGNVNSPAILSMIRAWPASEGVKNVVVTESEAVEWRMADEPERVSEPIYVVAGLDPGYGGDRCVLQIVSVVQSDGLPVLIFNDPFYVAFDDAKGPRAYQIFEQCYSKMLEYNVRSDLIAIDDSGPQSIADIFAMHLGVDVLRVSFGAKASTLPVSKLNTIESCKYYKNLITEYVFAIRDFAANGQIRRFPNAALIELTRRGVSIQIPKALESKADFKKSTGMGSPDTLDACALAVAVVRQRLGIFPGEILQLQVDGFNDGMLLYRKNLEIGSNYEQPAEIGGYTDE